MSRGILVPNAISIGFECDSRSSDPRTQQSLVSNGYTRTVTTQQNNSLLILPCSRATSSAACLFLCENTRNQSGSWVRCGLRQTFGGEFLHNQSISRRNAHMCRPPVSRLTPCVPQTRSSLSSRCPEMQVEAQRLHYLCFMDQ